MGTQDLIPSYLRCGYFRDVHHGTSWVSRYNEYTLFESGNFFITLQRFGLRRSISPEHNRVTALASYLKCWAIKRQEKSFVEDEIRKKTFTDYTKLHHWTSRTKETT